MIVTKRFLEKSIPKKDKSIRDLCDKYTFEKVLTKLDKSITINIYG